MSTNHRFFLLKKHKRFLKNSSDYGWRKVLKNHLHAKKFLKNVIYNDLKMEESNTWIKNTYVLRV